MLSVWRWDLGELTFTQRASLHNPLTESFIQGIIDYTLRVVCGHYSSSWRRARYMHACLLAVWLVGTWESLQRA